MVAPIYRCYCKNGETWQVTEVIDVDTERDEVYNWFVCDLCGRPVIEPKLVNGVQDHHALTDDEIFWMQEKEQQMDYFNRSQGDDF